MMRYIITDDMIPGYFRRTIWTGQIVGGVMHMKDKLGPWEPGYRHGVKILDANGVSVAFIDAWTTDKTEVLASILGNKE